MKKASFSLALLVALVPLFVSILQQVTAWVAEYKQTRDRVNGVTVTVQTSENAASAASGSNQNPDL